MLVVDLHALAAVHALHLIDQVVLGGLGVLVGQQVVRVDGSARHWLARLDPVTVAHDHPQRLADLGRGLAGELLVVGLNLHEVPLVLLLDPHHAVTVGHDRLGLGLAALEQLDHAGQTHGDVAAAAARHAAGVEGPHSELGAGFTDALGGHHAHGLAHADRLGLRQVVAVAFLAHTTLDLAVEGRANKHLANHLGVLGDQLHVF